MHKADNVSIIPKKSPIVIRGNECVGQSGRIHLPSGRKLPSATRYRPVIRDMDVGVDSKPFVRLNKSLVVRVRAAV